MPKFTVKHVQLEEAIASGDFNKIDIAVDAFTKENLMNYVSSALTAVIKKFTAVFGTNEKDLVYPKGFIQSTKRVMKRMSTTKFMDIMEIGFFIERGFNGNRYEFMRDCKMVQAESGEAFRDLHSDFVRFLKELNRKNGIVNKLPQTSLNKANETIGYEIVTKYFTGHEEMARIGECFNNNEELKNYLGSSISITPSAMTSNMKTMRNAMEEIVEMLEDSSEVLENADGRTVKYVIKYVETMSSKVRDHGAANAAIITNVGVATNLVAGLVSLRNL